MTQAIVRFYTVVKTECEITLPEGVSADEAEHHLRVNCNVEDPEVHPCLPDIYRAMNVAAEQLGGSVEWSDPEGIEIIPL
jgi:hypothetical protein